MSKYEGFFEEDIRLCYLWLKLTEGHNVDISRIEIMSIKEIQKYFENKQLDLSLFEGWEPRLRNSIAHLSFKFDKENEIMVYEDNHRNKQKWSKSLSLQDLFSMNQKLVNVNELVTVLFGLIFIRDFSLAYRNSS